MKTDSNTLQLNGRAFSIGTLPAIEAIKVEVAVARVIGEPLFKAFVTKSGDGGAMNEESMGAMAVGMLMAKMNADELLATMQTVFAYVSCDGQRVELNSTFTGRNREVWEVFIAALKFNFHDFFPESLFTSLPKEKLKGLK